MGKDDLADSVEKIDDFDDFKRNEGQTIQEYIFIFDSKYRKLEKKDMPLPSEIFNETLSIKLDPAYLAEDEDILLAAGYVLRRNSV